MTATIRALALDVDGVLTDGTVWWGPDEAEWKRFGFADIMGVSLACRAGLLVTLISGEDSPLVDRFARKFRLADITKGCRDKASAVRDFAARQELPLEAICYMGDDINDVEAMALVGLAVAPASAHPSARAAAHHVTAAAGGAGAVREVVDAILQGQLVPRRPAATA